MQLKKIRFLNTNIPNCLFRYKIYLNMILFNIRGRFIKIYLKYHRTIIKSILVNFIKKHISQHKVLLLLTNIDKNGSPH